MKYPLLAILATSALLGCGEIQEFGPNDDPGAWKLSEAIQAGDIRTVQSLVALGVQLNKEATKRNGHVQRSAAMGSAARLGRIDIAKLLLENGADPNTTESSGESALWIATRQGHREIVRLLLASGAEVNGSRVLMNTPLDVVNERISHFQTIKEILEENGGLTYRQREGLDDSR